MRVWFETLDAPLAIVQDDLRVRWINQPAQIELERRTGLELRDETLATRDPAYQEGLQRFVADARPVLSTWCFPCERGHVLLRAVEVHRDHLGRQVGISFTDTVHFHPVYRDLDRAFDLTEQEDRVLRDLIDAKRPEEIARRLGVRLATIRSHIRNLYDKLDVSCREELFRRVAPFRL